MYDGSGDLMYWNILGAGEIIGRAVVETSSTDRQYYVKDHLGSIRGTINEGGSVDHQSDYYPFGLEMPSRVWTTDPPRERYTGHEIEELGSNTTWYYAGARMYDPVVARWMTTDPLADKFPGWSPYNYTLDDPINRFDPDGAAPCPPLCGLIGLGFGAGVVESAVTAFEGVRQVVTDPVGTAKAVGTLARQDGVGLIARAQVMQGMYDGAVDRIDRVRNGSDFDRGRVAGEAFVASLEAAIGSKGTTSAVSRTLRAVDKFAGAGAAARAVSLVDLFADRTPAATEIISWAESQGFTRLANSTGPLKFVDSNGTVRVTIKRGSSRTPGSAYPHAELRDATGRRISPAGDPVSRRSPDNHTRIDWDLED